MAWGKLFKRSLLCGIKIKKNRKDLIKESTNEEIAKSEINDIKEIISILNDDDFKNFNAQAIFDMAYEAYQK